MAKDIYVPSPHAWRSQILISLAERNYLKNTSLGLLHFLLRDCHPCCRSCFCRSLIQLPLITASCTKKTWNWSGFIWTVQNLIDILRQGAVVRPGFWQKDCFFVFGNLIMTSESQEYKALFQTFLLGDSKHKTVHYRDSGACTAHQKNTLDLKM